MRSTTWFSAGSVQNVSCMVRAGWSGPRLRASKFSHSASTTGPSATSQPIATNTSAMSSASMVSGCRRARPAAGRRQGDVDGLLDEHPLLGLGLEVGLAGGERLVDLPPGLADPLAGLLAGLGRQRTDLAVGERQRRPVTRVVDAHLLERRQVAGRRDRGKGLLAHLLDLVGAQRRDLDGVVRRVGAGHAPQSRNRPPRPGEPVSRRRDTRSARDRPRFHPSQSSSGSGPAGQRLAAERLGQAATGRAAASSDSVARKSESSLPVCSYRSMLRWAIQASGLIAAMPSSPTTPVTSANRATQAPQETTPASATASTTTPSQPSKTSTTRRAWVKP